MTFSPLHQAAHRGSEATGGSPGYDHQALPGPHGRWRQKRPQALRAHDRLRARGHPEGVPGRDRSGPDPFIQLVERAKRPEVPRTGVDLRPAVRATLRSPLQVGSRSRVPRRHSALQATAAETHPPIGTAPGHTPTRATPTCASPACTSGAATSSFSSQSSACPGGIWSAIFG
jgi:hypothetical protein